MAILANTIEARFPGVRVVVEPYRSDDDETVRWWMYVLHCRRRDHRAASGFAFEVGKKLFDGGIPFITDPRDAWGTTAYVAEMRRYARAARRTRPPRKRIA